MEKARTFVLLDYVPKCTDLRPFLYSSDAVGSLYTNLTLLVQDEPRGHRVTKFTDL